MLLFASRISDADSRCWLSIVSSHVGSDAYGKTEVESMIDLPHCTGRGGRSACRWIGPITTVVGPGRRFYPGPNLPFRRTGRSWVGSQPLAQRCIKSEK